MNLNAGMASHTSHLEGCFQPRGTAKATSSALAGSRRNLATKKDLVTRDAHSQTFFPVAVGEAETAASPSPSPTFNAVGERVGRMGAGEAIDEPVQMESCE